MFLRGISMKKLLEILRLYYEHKLSHRQIEKVARCCRKTISGYISLFEASGLSWPLPDTYQDELALSKKLKPSFEATIITKAIDFVEVSKELRTHKHMTLLLLWEEYIEAKKTSYSYPHFASLYRKWQNKQPTYMRQIHKGGDKIFTDYSGDTISIIDTDTGVLREAQIFVGVLGASNYIYMEATWTQGLSDWVMSHVRMFEHIGGSSNLVVPDNLRSAVKKSHRYDPDITPSYYEMLAHYGSACMPARIYTPKDKAKAEGGVLIVQRWVLAKLRHELLHGLAALNIRLSSLMTLANNKRLQHYNESRMELFEELDKPNLRPLPNMRYVYRDYKKMRVSKDYHIELAGHYYSVPYKLINKEIDVWYNSNLVECYHNNICVAKHVRSSDTRRGKSTIREHMPIAHKEYISISPDKIKNLARDIGEATVTIVSYILQDAPHEEIGCKRSYGFLKLAEKYSATELESACHEALRKNIRHYEYIEIIIKTRAKMDIALTDIPAILHDNIRGSEYYH